MGTAKITYLHIPEYIDTVRLHCQEAIEKYLKAYLIFQNTEFKRTHNFIYLLDLIAAKDSDFSQHYDSLIELEGFVVDIRYPNESIFLTKDKVENVIKIAKNIRDFVTDKLNISIDYNEIIDK